MLDKAIKGDVNYWGWLGFLVALIGIGFIFYVRQFTEGLMVTGMSRDVSWGFYIGQLTYFVGVAASGVMVVLPYYLHDYKAFGRMTILGEFMAVAAIIVCLLFVLVDLGKVTRLLNLFMYPNFTSILPYDAFVLQVYMLLNIIVGWNVLAAEKKGVPYQKWVKVLAYISIPWAFSIHTVTAFLYAGLPGRHYWLSAIMAARFLASAFCSGPSLLLLLCLIVRRVSKFDPGRQQMQTLSKIIAYAMIFNMFFLLLELFTAFYSRIPGHMITWKYLFIGLTENGHYYGRMVPWMWTSIFFAVVALVLLIVPASRRNEIFLTIACISVLIATWIDKGFGLIVGGFVPNPFDKVFEYWPTGPELLISIMVWAIGLFILTVLFKIAVSVKEEIEA
jgi:Ni/Fe-hydrogenase subunit HybB-like protein